MNSCKWRLDISADLDEALSAERSQAVRRHLAACPDCAAFAAEQREVHAVLLQASVFQLEPSPAIWSGIESKIAARQAAEARRPGFRFAWADLFRVPQFGYGVAAVLLVLLTGVIATEVRQPAASEQEILARLDAYSIEAVDNPFLHAVSDENPFFQYQPDTPANPFDDRGVAR